MKKQATGFGQRAPRRMMRSVAGALVIALTAVGLLGLDSVSASASPASVASTHKSQAVKPPKVVVTKVTATASGTSVKSTITVKNTYSARTQAVSVRLYLIQGHGKFKLDSARVKSLKSGASSTIRVLRTVPASVPAGTYRVLACRGLTVVQKCRTSAGTIAVARAVLTAPAALSLGNVQVGSASAQGLVKVSNIGRRSTGALTVHVTGDDAFSLASTTCGSSLPAGASCTVSAVFAPGSPGTVTGSLVVSGQNANSITVALTGTGLGAGSLTIDKSSNAFTSTEVGSASSPTEFTVSNTGNIPTGIPTVTLTPEGTSDFTITADSCVSALAPAASCTVAVAFTPATAGDKSAALSISAAPGDSVSSDLSGTGLAPASLSIAPETLSFGNEVIDTTTDVQTVSVTNDGDTASGVPSVALNGHDADQFTIVSNDCTVGLDAGESCDVEVAFAPSAPGVASARLDVTATPGGPVSAALGGVGQTRADVTIDAKSYDFGYTDDPTEHVFTVTNGGDATTGVPDVDVSGSSAFTITTDTCTEALAGGTSCSVGVTYTGSGTTEQSATLSVEAIPGGTVTSDLTGSPSALTVEPNSHDYGGIAVGDTSDTVSYTVTNHRLTSVQIDSEGESGPFPQDTSCFAVVIPAGGTCTFSAHFAPTYGGSAIGEVDYSVGSDQAQLQLSGTGLTPASFSVSPSTVDFGAYTPGDTGTQQVTITNNGTEASDSTHLSIADANASEFAIDDSTCPTSLAGGASCTVTVTFTPTTLGDKTATLTMTGADGGTASLVGLGAPAGVTLVPAAHDFGSVGVGGAKNFTFRVVNTTNNGQDVNSVSSGSPFRLDLSQDFTCVLSIETIQPHRWCTVSLSFQPQSEGPFTRTLSVAGNNFNTTSQLSGTGVPAGTPARTTSRRTERAAHFPTSVTMIAGKPVVTYN